MISKFISLDSNLQKVLWFLDFIKLHLQELFGLKSLNRKIFNLNRNCITKTQIYIKDLPANELFTCFLH